VASGCAIAVMAKAPRAGYCKTRLSPPLSPDQAADLSRAFLRDITSNLFEAARHAPITPVVAFAPAGLEGLFDGVLAPGTRLVLADGSGDMPEDVRGFGRCLLHAVRSLLDEGFDSVCVLNADSPTLPTEYLVHAAYALAAPDAGAVLGPAEDGGYYLLGMRAPHAGLFADIAWSTAIVAAQTRERAQSCGVALHELPTWYDVDDAASLRRMLDETRSVNTARVAYHAPATTAAVTRMGLAEYLHLAA
jgi:rSAM/selenodomain-associated transferase 1